MDAEPKPTEPTQEAAAAVPADLVAQFNAIKAELLALKSGEAARVEEARRREQEELLKKGQLEQIAKNHEAALRARDEQYNTLLDRTRKAELSRALTAALSEHKLVPGAAAQLLKLWGDEFQVDETPDGGFAVRSRADLRDPRAVVAERFASKDWAHFLLPEGRSQPAAGATQSLGGQAAPARPQQGSFIEQINARLKAQYQPAGR